MEKQQSMYKYGKVLHEFALNGDRTNCTTGGVKRVEVGCCITDIGSGVILEITEGGITGYEGIYIHDMPEDRMEAMMDKGWAACLGTKGRYDTLDIDGSGLKLVFEWWRDHGKEQYAG